MADDLLVSLVYSALRLDFIAHKILFAAVPPEKSMYPRDITWTDKANSLQRNPNSLWFILLSYYTCLDSVELQEDG